MIDLFIRIALTGALFSVPTLLLVGLLGTTATNCDETLLWVAGGLLTLTVSLLIGGILGAAVCAIWGIT